MIKKTIILICLCAFTFTCMAQVGTKFSSKDRFGNTLWYEITSDSEVELCPKDFKDKSYGKMSKVAVPERVTFKGKDYVVTAIGKDVKFHFITWPTDKPKIHTKLNYIELPNTMTIIGKEINNTNYHPFMNCELLEEVILPENLKILPAYSFYRCISLKKIRLPKTLTSICDRSFSECESLSEIEIPNSVTSIGEGAFLGCNSLKEIHLPSSVTFIGSCAFTKCESLKKITGFHAGITYKNNCGGVDLLDWKYKESFEYCVNSHIIPGIKEWQKKRDFETRAQYQERVTKENQEKKVQELMQDAIRDYTSRAKNRLAPTLGSYDADYQLYRIQTNYGDKFVKVSLSEAPTFKENFKNAKFDATYIATQDGIAINDLTISLNGNNYQTEKSAMDLSTYNIELPTFEIPYQQPVLGSTTATSTPKLTQSVDYSIDQNIPQSSDKNQNTFAVIIGNEKYTQVAQVPYASNDARIFAEYCKKTLGLPDKNIRTYPNATYGTLLSGIADIKRIAEAYKGNLSVIFYYAGHGIPNESTKDAYLLPVDADGLQTEACYPLSRLYMELGSLGAKNVIVFMDACFSGSQRGDGMLASARGVALKAKSETPQGNMVVFSAASGDETAYPYQEKGHGLFTYYLLKKLQESKGNCTLGDLGEYIQTNVTQQSVVINRKSQTPTVNASSSLGESWKKMKLK